MGNASQSRPTLVFIYNADSGLFNGLADITHKLLSPSTYACRLCALTHGHLGMRREWRTFLESLDCDMEFLHADEARKQLPLGDLKPPAVLRRDSKTVPILLSASEINSCTTLDELKRLLASRLTATRR
jgi:hypothetical protein